jgi:hypothetical protein
MKRRGPISQGQRGHLASISKRAISKRGRLEDLYQSNGWEGYARGQMGRGPA